MKPYNELTHLGQLRRIRQLAEVAIKAYGWTGAHLTFIQYEANITYRVDVPGQISKRGDSHPYVPNRYLMRILLTNNMEHVKGELAWLAALSRQAGLPVPEPVPNQEGKLLTKITTTGIPNGRIVSMMRWIDGRRLTTAFRPNHFQAWGRMAAQMHKFSAVWEPPKEFKRPHWDWEGQLGGRYFRCTVEELVAMMPQDLREIFIVMSKDIRAVMKSLGKGSDVYGMIHADMYPENVLFKYGKAYLIDFEDCGFGYWLWDIAVALCTWPWTDEYYWNRDSFLDGYSQIFVLPESQIEYIDLFVAAQYATMVLWATLFIKNDPSRKAKHEKWRNDNATKLLRYFERC